MWCDGGGIISQDAHGTNPCQLRLPEKGGRWVSGRAYHIRGFLTQGVAVGEVSGGGLFGGSS